MPKYTHIYPQQQAENGLSFQKSVSILFVFTPENEHYCIQGEKTQILLIDIFNIPK